MVMPAALARSVREATKPPKLGIFQLDHHCTRAWQEAYGPPHRFSCIFIRYKAKLWTHVLRAL
jgi:hypothetical protein